MCMCMHMHMDTDMHMYIHIHAHAYIHEGIRTAISQGSVARDGFQRNSNIV